MKVDIIKNPQKFSSSEFFSAICHELKTPLSAIVGFSEILKEDITNPNLAKNCADYVREINIIANDLNELVHDLLDVGQLDSGDFSVNLSKEINLRDVVERSVRINYDYAIRRNITINTEISSELGLVKLDEKRMKQILINLISNAIKYSPKNNHVLVMVNNNNVIFPNMSAVEITIKDYGFGMNEQQVQDAFLKYKTIKNPNSGYVDSFGFGLVIVQKLVELQNGMIEVESNIGQGTTIKLFFPHNQY